MYTLIAQNQYGDALELTHNEAYAVTDITGFDPPEAQINTSHNAGADGSVFNSSYVSDREIIITLSVNYPAEENRINLYTYFKTKFPVRLYYKTSTRDVYIDGYVSKIDVQYFEMKQIVQITITCPKPYLIGTATSFQEFVNVNALFEFVFSIDENGIEFSTYDSYVEKNIINYGDVDAGMIIRIHATGTVSTPTIYNVLTREFLTVNTTLTAGDEIYINTKLGEKAITLTHGGSTSSIVGLLEEGSTWFQLTPSDNVFTLAAASGSLANLIVNFELENLYEGI